MVFDLKVQAAEKPGRHPAIARKVDSGFDLMYRPGLFDAPGVRSRHRELSWLHHVCQQEHDTHRDSQHELCHRVERQCDPPGVEHHWNHEGHNQKDTLAAEENRKIPSLRARDSMGLDPARDKLLEIVMKMPLDRYQPVERPEIEVLPAMKFESFLMWSHPAEAAPVDVCVMVRDVGIGVMEHGVLPVPKIRTAADEI